MDDEKTRKLVHTLLSNMYEMSCNCRKVYRMNPHLHPDHHSEDCPFRLEVENDEQIRRIFYEE